MGCSDAFELAHETRVIVPSAFHPDTWIGKRKRHYDAARWSWDPAMTGKRCRKASVKVESSTPYRLQIYRTLRTLTSEDCLQFLANKGAVLLGITGATLGDYADLSPGWYVSFDIEDKLPKTITGERVVPVWQLFADGSRFLTSTYFKEPIHTDSLVLCFSTC